MDAACWMRLISLELKIEECVSQCMAVYAGLKTLFGFIHTPNLHSALGSLLFVALMSFKMPSTMNTLHFVVIFAHHFALGMNDSSSTVFVPTPEVEFHGKN